MEVPNINLLFNKILFKRLHNADFFKKDTKNIHKKLFTLPLDLQIASLLDVRNNVLTPDKNRGIEIFDLTTAWPGILIGLGYGHSTGNSDDEFKNGFYFDFTTGLPILPGSTVKGILRSFFPERFDISVNDKKLRVEVLAKKSNVLKRLISILNDLDIKPNISFGANEWNEETIKELENIIFEGKVSGNKISSNIQDVFFDAFPKNAGKSNVVEGNVSREHNGVFLGEDIITPHRHPLKDPVPLRFLKVLPGVTFQFQFFLNSIGISNEDKRKLFEELLLRFGAGAKSSVGFGKFRNPHPPYPKTDQNWFISFKSLPQKKWDEEPDEEQDDSDSLVIPKKEVTNKIPEITETDDWIDPLNLKTGSVLKATVLTSSNGNLLIRLHIKGIKIVQNMPGKAEKDSIINVKVQNTEGKLDKGNFKVKVIPSK
jgi:CRISPR-associated protein Cmr6